MAIVLFGSQFMPAAGAAGNGSVAAWVLPFILQRVKTPWRGFVACECEGVLVERQRQVGLKAVLSPDVFAAEETTNSSPFP